MNTTNRKFHSVALVYTIDGIIHTSRSIPDVTIQDACYMEKKRLARHSVNPYFLQALILDSSEPQTVFIADPSNS